MTIDVLRKATLVAALTCGLATTGWAQQEKETPTKRELEQGSPQALQPDTRPQPVQPEAREQQPLLEEEERRIRQERELRQEQQKERQPGALQGGVAQPGQFRVQKHELQQQVTSINKASSLIGMEVKNLQNEELGEIKDIVFDFHSGKIAYVVLSVGGFLGLNEKYLAIPMNALAAPEGEGHLLLNANKQTIENAEGFAKQNYPDLNHQNWGAGVGIKSEAQGTQNLTTEQGAGAGQQPSPGVQQLQVFSGTVSEVNPEERTLTAEGPEGKQKFKIKPNAQLRKAGNQEAELIDLKEGTKITVQFRQGQDGAIAESITAGPGPQGGQP